MTDEMTLPLCDDECGRFIRDHFSDGGIEVTVSHLPPLVPGRYEPLGMRCPHGILWHCEPTSDQQAAWARAGVE
jgi:hypothetical protein